MFLIAFTAAPSGPGVARNQTAAAAPSSVTVTGFIRKTVSVDDQSYAYVVYVPPDYTPERPWPVILFLHGAGERGDDGFLQTDIGIGRAIRRHHRNIPAIVVMPQCRPNESWVGPMAGMALRCVELTSREYNLDPKRVSNRPHWADGGGPQVTPKVGSVVRFAESRSRGWPRKLPASEGHRSGAFGATDGHQLAGRVESGGRQGI